MADKQSTGEATKSVVLTAAAKKCMPETLKTASVGCGEEKPANPEQAMAQPTAYSMRPAFGEMFPLPIIKHIMNTVMAEKLKGKFSGKIETTSLPGNSNSTHASHCRQNLRQGRGQDVDERDSR